MCGLFRMVEENPYCIDVLIQIRAISAGLRRIEDVILKDHVAHCVEHVVASDDPADQRQKVNELLEVLGRP